MSTDLHVPFVKIMDGTTDGTNAAIVDSSGNLQVEVTNSSIAGTAGTPNAGVLSVQGITSMTPVQTTEGSGSAIKTAVELIDDAVYVDDADWTDSTSKHLLVGGLYQASQQTITDGDVGPVQVNSKGNLLVETTNPAITGTAGSPNANLLGVQGPTAPDTGISAYPITIGGRVAGVTGQPTGMSADGDVVNLQLDAQGRIVPNGPVASDVAVTGNPLLIGGRAATTPQTDVNADGDAVFLRMDRHGCAFVQVHESLPAGTNAIGKLSANSGVDIGDVDVLSLPALTVDKCIQWSNYTNIYTSAQTSQDLVAASGSTKFYIGRITVTANYNTSQAGRTTVQVYFGTGAVSDTSKHVFRGTFITVPATSTESYPGHTIGTGQAPFIISAASDALKITTTTSGTHCGIFVSVDYIRV